MGAEGKRERGPAAIFWFSAAGCSIAEWKRTDMRSEGALHGLDNYLTLSPEVDAALEAQRPLVALESTVIAHGLPYPVNVQVAQQMEEAIRGEGAVPATIGLRAGRIVVGLSPAEIEQLATAPHVLKVSRRDLAVALATHQLGATTVAGTMLCASLAGIRFFATGGIGGVHRGAQTSMDISADLSELGRTPVLVVCAGAKSILDLDLTLEYLETQGVPVLGWQTDTLPAFYVRSSGRMVAQRVDEPAMVAAIAHAHWECGLGGLVVACPIPAAYAMDPEPLASAIDEALRLAGERHICGSATTPFLLSHIAHTTAGESVAANQALLVNNARWAARFASAYAHSVPDQSVGPEPAGSG
jgi:pseudouridine-5'-phosphate glycosidase